MNRIDERMNSVRAEGKKGFLGSFFDRRGSPILRFQRRQ